MIELRENEIFEVLYKLCSLDVEKLNIIACEYVNSEKIIVLISAENYSRVKNINKNFIEKESLDE